MHLLCWLAQRMLLMAALYRALLVLYKEPSAGLLYYKSTADIRCDLIVD
jgi:hypothetical protein